MLKFLRRSIKLQIVGILTAAGVFGLGRVERTGDSLQIALPIAGLACAVTNGESAKYAIRFVSTMAAVHIFKRGLGDAPINHRPSGSLQGFPSGHTAAAAFGVSYLVHNCLQKAPILQGITILSGGYVGASRIEGGAHYLFQVLAGALFGWLGERSNHLVRGALTFLFRNNSRSRRWNWLSKPG